MPSPYRAVNTVSVIQTSKLMLYREIIAVCSEIHTEHINILCGPNIELLSAKPGGTYSDQWTVGMLTSVPLPQGKDQLVFVNTLMNVGAEIFLSS